MKCPKCGERLNTKWVAQELGHTGGCKSAKVRMADETPAQTVERMRRMAQARWNKPKEKDNDGE